MNWDNISDAVPPDVEDDDAPPVALADLLDHIQALLVEYVVFRSEAQRTAATLWVAHTWVLDAFSVTPYLSIRSAERRSGKSRLLEVIVELVPRPEFTSRLSEAAMFRLIESEDGPPTLLIDEIDTVFKGPANERTEGLRALLNCGWRRGLTIPRCVGMGKRITVHRFPTFCAKAFAGIGDSLPDTVVDRSISVALARRKKSEPVAKLRVRRYAAAAAIVRQALAEWAEGAVERLRDVEPSVPDLGNDRAEDIWEPLLAVADSAGSHWPLRARAAAIELHPPDSTSESINVILLGAIREVFHAVADDRILTVDLLRALIEREAEPWGGWWGKDVDQAKDGETPRKPAMELARRLKLFDVRPKKLRVGDRTANGYELSDFQDAFDRHLPPKQPEGRNNGTTHGAQGFPAFRPTSGGNGVGTPETVGAEGLCRRSDLEAGREPRGDDGDGEREPGAVFETGPWQVCLRCGGRRWRHRVRGDECVTCTPEAAS
jgi:hypothetical protein